MVGFFVKTSFSWNYEHERGLSIQEHYTVRGITLDRPKQKGLGKIKFHLANILSSTW